MKLSLNLLKQFVQLDTDAHEIADRITLSLTEVETIEKHGEDTVLEIENKALTHRPDCFSHLGIAREIAAYFDKEIKDPIPELSAKQFATPNKPLPIDISVQSPDNCPRYTAIVLSGIQVRPSPDWLKSYIEAVGIRPVNNVVDFTNYVMIELGQPLHAFDYDTIHGHAIQVRMANDGETITTLDGKARTLTPEMLVIADAEKPIGIAGVMGGAHTEVTEKTTTIVLESANFEAKNNRRTSKTLNLRTDAVTRYEKGLNPTMTYPALVRAVNLLTEHANAEVASIVTDIALPDTNKKRNIIKVRHDWINTFLGTSLTDDQITTYLKRLHLEVTSENGSYRVTVPMYRSDLTMQADIAEEIARIYGYDKIPAKVPIQSDFTPRKNMQLFWTFEAKKYMQSAGFTEVMTPPFVGDELLKKARLDGYEHFELVNPLTVEQKYMRRMLVPSLLEAVVFNIPRFDDISLFEINRLYVPQEGKDPLEPVYLTAVTTQTDYRTFKGIVEALFDTFGIDTYSFKKYPSDCGIFDAVFHAPRTAQIYIGGKPMGIMGYIHPEVSTAFGFEKELLCMDIHMGTLAEHAVLDKPYKPIPQFPPVVEDITLRAKDNQTIGDIVTQIQSADPLITDVQYKQTYNNNHTFTVTFQSHDRTLTTREVEDIKRKIDNY